MTEDLSPAVEAARHGDEQAFRQLYRAIQPGLLRYLHTLVGPDADDVASETWYQVIRDLHSFKGDGTAFRRWAVTIGRNRAMDYLRYQQRRPAVSVPTETLSDVHTDEDTETLALQALSTDSALALIGTLPPDQAEAVLLRAVVGLDAESTGRILGKSSGAVRTAAYRGLRRLNELLTKADEK